MLRGRKMNEKSWMRWTLQTARNWDDLSSMLFKTGVQQVDADHKKMAEYALEINKLIDQACLQEFDLKMINRQLDLVRELLQYTREHFSREEILMEKYELPGVDEHKKKHTRILGMLEDMLADFESGRSGISQKLKFEILEWVVTHINEVDKNQFHLDNWKKAMNKAEKWDDVAVFIRKTGVKQVDDEHREMTEKALSLSRFSAQSPQKEIEAAFFELLEAAERHFANEIEIIKHYKIDGLGTQEAEHVGFIQMVNKYLQNFTEDKKGFAEFRYALLRWWINHINVTDYETVGIHNWGVRFLSATESREDVQKFIRRVGNEEIDADHVKLVELVLDLCNALAEKREEAVRFKELIDFVREHFLREERLMTGNSGLYQRHRREHKDLIIQLENHKKNYDAGEISMSASMKTTLLYWLINHTNETDYETFAKGL
jgi:hemerythrin